MKTTTEKTGKMKKLEFRYVIVKLDGSNVTEITEMLNNDWSVVKSFVADNAVHHILSKSSYED